MAMLNNQMVKQLGIDPLVIKHSNGKFAQNCHLFLGPSSMNGGFSSAINCNLAKLDTHPQSMH